MKILVMGAGAVGSYFGGRMAVAGENVVFCARGSYLKAFRERGIAIKSIRGALKLDTICATDDPREFAPYDLILFCVKAYDTDTAAKAIAGCLRDGGAILTLQNGVENEQRLGAIFGPDAIMGGNARVGVEMIQPGDLVHLSSGHIDFGELDGRETERARRIAEAFRRAGILGELTPKIKTLRWDKLVWNGAFNSVATISRCRVGGILDDPEGLRLVTDLMREIIAVARADGAEIEFNRVDSYLAHSQKNLRAIKTSTQQDLERGKRLEYEALAGAVVRAAHRHGIAVPIMETIYALLKLIDGSRARRS